MLTLSKNDRLFILGDSLQTGFSGSYGVSWVFCPLIRAMFPPVAMPNLLNPFTPPATHKAPRVDVNAVAGRKTGDISGGMPALLSAYYPATAMICQLNTNDLLTVVPQATTIANAAAIVDAVQTWSGMPYAKMLWLGAWTGVPQPATGLLDVAMAGLAALRGFSYVPLSDVVSGFPTYNLIDNVHPTQAGSQAMSAKIMRNVTVGI